MRFKEEGATAPSNATGLAAVPAGRATPRRGQSPGPSDPMSDLDGPRRQRRQPSRRQKGRFRTGEAKLALGAAVLTAAAGIPCLSRPVELALKVEIFQRNVNKKIFRQFVLCISEKFPKKWKNSLKSWNTFQKIRKIFHFFGKISDPVAPRWCSVSHEPSQEVFNN